MKRVLAVVVTTAVLAHAVPAFAGGEHCTAATQECLDMMAKSLENRGYIGIEMDKNEAEAVVIEKVVEDSPAEAAGIQAGDVLLTINGMAPDEAFEALHEKMLPGTELALVVERGSREKNLTVTLAKAPEDLVVRWVGAHMLQHTSQTVAEEE